MICFHMNRTETLSFIPMFLHDTFMRNIQYFFLLTFHYLITEVCAPPYRNAILRAQPTQIYKLSILRRALAPKLRAALRMLMSSDVVHLQVSMSAPRLQQDERILASHRCTILGRANHSVAGSHMCCNTEQIM